MWQWCGSKNSPPNYYPNSIGIKKDELVLKRWMAANIVCLRSIRLQLTRKTLWQIGLQTFPQNWTVNWSRKSSFLFAFSTGRIYPRCWWDFEHHRWAPGGGAYDGPTTANDIFSSFAGALDTVKVDWTRALGYGWHAIYGWAKSRRGN